jgi:hypothetical protein
MLIGASSRTEQRNRDPLQGRPPEQRGINDSAGEPTQPTAATPMLGSGAVVTANMATVWKMLARSMAQTSPTAKRWPKVAVETGPPMVSPRHAPTRTVAASRQCCPEQPPDPAGSRPPDAAGSTDATRGDGQRGGRHRSGSSSAATSRDIGGNDTRHSEPDEHARHLHQAPPKAPQPERGNAYHDRASTRAPRNPPHAACSRPWGRSAPALGHRVVVGIRRDDPAAVSVDHEREETPPAPSSADG